MPSEHAVNIKCSELHASLSRSIIIEALSRSKCVNVELKIAGKKYFIACIVSHSVTFCAGMIISIH